MEGYSINIEKATIDNKYYRRVLYTTRQNQIVLMNIPPGEDIPLETHHNISQFIRIEEGEGLAHIGSKTHKLHDGMAIDIPSSVPHQIINTSATKELKLYTIYSPPEHPDGLIQIFKPLNNSIEMKNCKKQILYLFLL